MIVNFSHLLLLGLLTASAHWLVARSTIAMPLWSRATGALDALLRCPACSGVWLALAAFFMGLHPVVFPWGGRYTSFIANLLLGAILTPVFEGLLLWGLEMSALPARETETVSHEVVIENSGNTEDAVTPNDLA